MPSPDAQALLDEVTFGSATGGRRGGATLPVAAVVRGLTPEDIPTVLDGERTGPIGIARLRASHHQLAQVLAGGMSLTEASLTTGYAPNYISILKADPTFQELLSSYESEALVKFADVLERCKVLGLAGMDELQHRLEVDPDSWTKREMMEFTELMLSKIPTASRNASAPAPLAPPTFNIQLVAGSASPPREVQGKVLDALPEMG